MNDNLKCNYSKPIVRKLLTGITTIPLILRRRARRCMQNPSFRLISTLFRFINDEQENAKSKFASNNVITSKYTLWNFLPKFLFENLNPRYKFANFYFVIAGILQVCPPSFHGRLAAMIDDSFHHYYESLSICIDFCRIRAIDGGLYSEYAPIPSTVPLSECIVTQDIKRHKSDDKTNNTLIDVYDNETHHFRRIPQKDIKVGDIVKVYSP